MIEHGRFGLVLIASYTSYGIEKHTVSLNLFAYLMANRDEFKLFT